MSNEIQQITSAKDFDELLNSNTDKLVLVHIELEQIPVCKTINEGLAAITRDDEFRQQINVCRLSADHFTDLLTKENVTAAPTVLFYYQNKSIDRVVGFNQNDLLKKLKQHLKTIEQTPKKHPIKSEIEISTENKIKQLLKSTPIILFMKGTPTEPQCGFSRQACHLLDEHHIKFDYFDILTDQNLREQLKKYSNWNTYPQLYVNGELIGGLDIMKQLIENDEFHFENPKADMNKYLESLINQAPLMLFVVGTPQAPQCKFTKELFQLLNRIHVTNYKYFDIMTDEDVQEQLKVYSSWKTYPQIYVNGQLIGGLDILKQLDEQGTLIDTLNGKQGVPV